MATAKEQADAALRDRDNEITDMKGHMEVVQKKKNKVSSIYNNHAVKALETELRMLRSVSRETEENDGVVIRDLEGRNRGGRVAYYSLSLFSTLCCRFAGRYNRAR